MPVLATGGGIRNGIGWLRPHWEATSIGIFLLALTRKGSTERNRRFISMATQPPWQESFHSICRQSFISGRVAVANAVLGHRPIASPWCGGVFFSLQLTWHNQSF
jgi:hypothetical protein